MKTTNENLSLSAKCYFAITLILISINAYSQVTFKQITSNDGLSENYITVLYRDSKDYLWIGTIQKGLNKYDGSNITIYENTGDLPGELSNNRVKCIYEDSKNNLWIGTQDGLNLYDRKSNSFKVFRHNPPDVGNFVECIVEDKKGNLLIAYNYGVGLIKWDFENDTFTRYKIECPDGDCSANNITSIQEDSNGNIWLASISSGIYRFEPESGSFAHYLDADLNCICEKNLFIDPKGIIWIGTNGQGVFSFDPTTSSFKHFGTKMGNQGVNNNHVRKIIQSDDTHLLIATDQGGINKYDMTTSTFEYIIYDEKYDQGLNSSGIREIYQDKEGILWVGTTRGGINVYNPKEGNNFKLFRNNKKKNSLSYNIVGCFFEDSEGMIWVGTDGGGVNVFNPKTGSFKKIYKHDPYDPYSISGDVIRCISEDKDGDIWIGTWEEGLNRFDRKENRFYHYFHNPNDSSSIASNTIWNLMIDHNDRIWLSSYNEGVELFAKGKGVVKRFKNNPGDANSISHNLVWQINEDFQYNIWFNTCAGINLFDTLTNKFIVYDGFPDNNIRTFCRDKEGGLWAGSISRGLFLFDQDGTVLEVYNTKNGLPDNTIHAIQDDDKGNLWISTEKGITRFNKKSNEFKNYSKNDGLQGNAFFEQSSLKTRSGNIYFGGYNGFNSFHPDSMMKNNYPPKVYITDFRIFNKSVQPGVSGSPLQDQISETEEITLSWHQNVFSFGFVAINYTYSNKNKYAYKMEGFEKEWNYINNDKQYITYTNLDPGKYTFRLKASNNNSVWNEEGTSIKIIILPPWWKTILFRIVSICSALLLILVFIEYRTYKLRKQRKLLARKVSERTAQLQKANTILEENQVEISMQNEELQQQKELLQEANRILEEQAIEIEVQNNELNRHHNQLEYLVKERTADLVTAMEKAKESDRLKSAFLSNMSHEIRTPMNAIIGFSSILSEPGLSDTEKEELISYIKTSSEGLLVLINDILEMSKIQANQLVVKNKLVNVIDIMNELLVSFQLQAQPKRIELIMDAVSFGDTLICTIDPLRLKQVLSNLLGNAIKFTQTGFVKFGIDKKDNEFITFYVKDTGIGIQKEVGDSIFERFMKVESITGQLFEGVGIGLSICSDIVKALGGKIWYESTFGEGTTFYFTLPNINNLKIDEPGAEEIIIKELPDLENKQILVVEGDEANYKVLKFYLANTKAKLTWAKNGAEAMDNININNTYDLILMDLKLPLMNGIDVSKHIRELIPDQIIVAQTDFVHHEEKSEFMKFNFNDYIEKPIVLEKLMDVIQKVL